MSDSKPPTLRGVSPLKYFLINKCCVNDADKEGIKEVKCFLGVWCEKYSIWSLGNFFYLLGKRLEEKWEISNEHLIATLIHPNLKPFHMCPHFREHAIDLLKQEMLKRQNASSTGTSDAANSPTLSSLTPATASTSNSLSARKNLYYQKKILLKKNYRSI